MHGQTKRDMLTGIEFRFLTQFSVDTRIINLRRYYTKKDVVDALSRKMSLDECRFVSNLYKKNQDPIAAANIFLGKFNPTSNVIKTRFVEYLIRTNKLTSVLNDVCFFEFDVGGARTDISRVNTHSYAFEIKTARDRPDKAYLQTMEFSRLFEYVSVIKNPTSEVAVADNVGVFLIELDGEEIVFKREKKPVKNSTNPTRQLMALPKTKLKELTDLNSNEKSDLVDDISSRHDGKEINMFFKNILKRTYKDKWVEFYEKHSPTNVSETLFSLPSHPPSTTF